METVNIILCGLGGQGILFVTKVMARAAVDKGYSVIGAETHGMAQRGGSVVSHLRIGPAQSSLVRAGEAHILLALEENEGYRNLSFMAPGASMYVNTDSATFPRKEVASFLAQESIECKGAPAGKIALDLSAPLSSNLALLGFFSAFGKGPISHEELRQTIDTISPERFKEKNLKVFDTCHEWGLKRSVYHDTTHP